jgi:hypothetical protein
LNLEAALDAAPAALTPPLLEAWLASERDREAAQWAPRRAEAPGGDADEDSEEEESIEFNAEALLNYFRLTFDFGNIWQEF